MGEGLTIIFSIILVPALGFAIWLRTPQGRELRIPLTDPNQNEKLENFEYNGKHITNFEMESSALAGLARLMGHKATTVCMVIANRRIKKADTGYKSHIDDLIKEVLERL